VTVLLRVSMAGRGVVVLAVLPTADWAELVREDDCASGLADVCLEAGAPASALGDIDSRGVGGDWDASAGCVTGPAVGDEFAGGDSLVSAWVSAACDGAAGAPGAGPGPAAGAVSTVPGSGDRVEFTDIQ
jgi:hypothetical protein